jgi:transcriptional regulator with XRE-family HTH domain
MGLIDKEQLQDFRKKKLRMTQAEIAEQLRIKRTTYANYELGVANPPVEVIRELVRLGFNGTPQVSSNLSATTTKGQLRILLNVLRSEDSNSELKESAYRELVSLLDLS